ncbi:MAG: sulfurtransferase complex subunit TusC [Gammaproteobacteria bacterium]|nr:sulfurtransferase complex subunit TusC [Gammaproteobacteria bacterium]
MKKRFLFVNRRAPHGTIHALESLEVLLITAAFDQQVSVAFIDDGVYQLLKQQDTRNTDLKNFSPTYRALHDYEIDKIYVDRESLQARGLNTDDLVVSVDVMTRDQLAALMEAQDVVLSF